MAATVTSRGTTLNTTAGNKTVTATPAANDLIVIITVATGVTTSSVTDDQGGTYTQVDSTRTGFSTSGNLQAWVRTALIPSAISTVFTANQASSTGGGLNVISVSGMSFTGASAVRSSGGQSTGTSGTTPAPVLSLTPLSMNPIITAVANGTNSTTTVVQRTGYTEDFDNGYTTPAAGLEVSHLASGETTATITYGGTTASAFASIALEIQFNASPTTVLNTPADIATDISTTPTLNFTGTDADADTVEYEVQIDTVNTFNSQIGTGPVHDTDVTGGGNGVNSFNFGAITTGGANRLLIAVISYSNGTPTGVTFSGGGLTWHSLATRVANGGSSTNGYTDIYYTLAPSTLSAVTITATMTGGGFPQVSGVISAYSATDISGTDGSGAIGNVASTSGAGANPSQTVTTTRNNSLVIGLYGQANNNTYTAGTNETINAQVSGGGTVSRSAQQIHNAVTATSGTSVTEAITVIASSWAAFAVEIKTSATPLLDKLSTADAGFTAGHPFASGTATDFTVQVANTLTVSTTYYWRVRAIDPSGTNTYGAYATTRSFTTNSGVTTPIGKDITPMQNTLGANILQAVNRSGSY